MSIFKNLTRRSNVTTFDVKGLPEKGIQTEDKGVRYFFEDRSIKWENVPLGQYIRNRLAYACLGYRGLSGELKKDYKDHLVNELAQWVSSNNKKYENVPIGKVKEIVGEKVKKFSPSQLVEKEKEVGLDVMRNIFKELNKELKRQDAVAERMENALITFTQKGVQDKKLVINRTNYLFEINDEKSIQAINSLVSNMDVNKLMNEFLKSEAYSKVEHKSDQEKEKALAAYIIGHVFSYQNLTRLAPDLGVHQYGAIQQHLIDQMLKTE